MKVEMFCPSLLIGCERTGLHTAVGCAASECGSQDRKNESQLDHIWTQGYKTFFMLNSAEHEIFFANKYENANNSWHFHIY